MRSWVRITVGDYVRKVVDRAVAWWLERDARRIDADDY